VKSAFTRAYNKQVTLLPYAPASVVSKKRAVALENDVLGNEEVVESDNEDEDDVTNNAMIKVSLVVFCDSSTLVMLRRLKRNQSVKGRKPKILLVQVKRIRLKNQEEEKRNNWIALNIVQFYFILHFQEFPNFLSALYHLYFQ
jgi:hypothetical protein